jgi:hypothetical protein
MQGEREPERPSSVVTDIGRATEKRGEVRRSYVQVLRHRWLACSEVTGSDPDERIL